LHHKFAIRHGYFQKQIQQTHALQHYRVVLFFFRDVSILVLFRTTIWRTSDTIGSLQSDCAMVLVFSVVHTNHIHHGATILAPKAELESSDSETHHALARFCYIL
jgi:hypothetical protein